MSQLFIFAMTIVWGALAGQFLAQMIASTIGLFMFLSALAFSRVVRTLNLIGFGVMLLHLVLFSLLFVGGNWLSNWFIDYTQWTAGTIASVASFVFTLVYCVAQIPGKFLLNRMCAWQPGFFEAQQAIASQDRVAFARRCRASQSAS